MTRTTSLAVMPRSFSFPSSQDFFQSVDWFWCLADTVFPDERAEIFFSEDSSLVLRPTLLGAESYTNFYTMNFRIGPNPQPIIEEFVRSTSPIQVDLKFVPEDDAVHISESFVRTGFNVHQYFMYENWYADVRGQSFDAYLSKRPSQLKNTLRRKKKALQEDHRVDVRIDGGGELVGEFINIYERSWKRPEPYPNFIPMLASTCAKLGILRIGVLHIDGNPAAAQFWITTPRKATIYKLAYMEEYKSHSVGTILSAEMFRQALDVDGVAEIDYGVGSEAYKRDWMDASRQLVGLRAYKRASFIGASLWYWQRLKSIAKSLRSRPRVPAALQPSFLLDQGE